MEIEIQTDKIWHQGKKARQFKQIKMDALDDLPTEYVNSGNRIWLKEDTIIVATTDDRNIGVFFSALMKSQMPLLMQIKLSKRAILFEDEFHVFMHFVGTCASRLRQIKNKYREEQKEDNWQGTEEFHV